jgi:uncharacterized membrane protein YhaH (DUF805 family)
VPSDAWFYVQDGQKKGPLTLEALVEFLAALPDPQGTLVWSQGLQGWTRAGDVPALAPRLPPPITASLEREISGKGMPPTDPPVARQGNSLVQLVLTESPKAQPKQAMPVPAVEPVGATGSTFLEEPLSSNPFILYGRAFKLWRGTFSQREYCILVGFTFAATFGVAALVAAVYGASGATPDQSEELFAAILALSLSVIGVPSILGGTVRRLRDVGKSAWYMLVFLVPCFGFVTILFLMAERGSRSLPPQAPPFRAAVQENSSGAGVEATPRGDPVAANWLRVLGGMPPKATPVTAVPPAPPQVGMRSDDERTKWLVTAAVLIGVIVLVFGLAIHLQTRQAQESVSASDAAKSSAPSGETGPSIGTTGPAPQFKAVGEPTVANGQAQTARMEWSTSNPCGRTVRARLFDNTNGLVWPSSGQYYSANPGGVVDVTITCRLGANICFGAAADPPSNSYWGVGLEGRNTCRDCCYACANTRVDRPLICN